MKKPLFNTFYKIILLTFAVVLMTAGSSFAKDGHNDSHGKEMSKKSETQKHEAININTATVKELTRLKGVGSKTAEAIVSYREAHGSFKNASDIMKVKGIGEKTFEKIKADITVGEY